MHVAVIGSTWHARRPHPLWVGSRRRMSPPPNIRLVGSIGLTMHRDGTVLPVWHGAASTVQAVDHANLQSS
jgi:hypothetical protein